MFPTTLKFAFPFISLNFDSMYNSMHFFFMSHIRYFCANLCGFDQFARELESIIQEKKYFSFVPDDAVNLIQHHHRFFTTKDVLSKPLVIVFVDEARILAESSSLRMFPTKIKTSLDVLKSREVAIHYSWQLTRMLTAIGSCLSRVPDFHALITSLENSTLLEVGVAIYVSICDMYIFDCSGWIEARVFSFLIFNVSCLS
jgi:hypothetical protein